MKKTIAFLVFLCFVCTITLVPVMSAEDLPEQAYPDVLGTEYETAVLRMTQLKALTGYEDGNFRPENSMTRAEFTAMITRVLSLNQEVEEASGDQSFSDIEAGYWATPHINVALDRNIISGYGDGRFGPEDPVTYEQAVKIIVEALGYGGNAQEKAPYPWGHLIVGGEKGITFNAMGRAGDDVSRGIIAKMMYNSLNIMVKSEGIKLVEVLAGRTFYVSPSGSDNNPGTLRKPWKSLKKAAHTVEAGSTVILEDGEYHEEEVTIVTNGGTKDAPIIFRSRNRLGAKVIYSEYTRLMNKFQITENYITVQDIDFSQKSMANDNDGTKTLDIFMSCRGGAENINIIGNRFTGAFEEGIKLGRTKNVLIDGNIITQMNHEGIDSFHSTDTIIRNNHITEIGRVGIMVKGNADNNIVYNNYVGNEERLMRVSAFTVGGESNSTSPSDVAKDTGFEAYNSVFYNNVVYSGKPGLIPAGFNFLGARDCKIYNNIVIGTQSAVRFNSAPGVKNGWGWDPPNINPVVMNNIFANCSSTGYDFVKMPENLVSDYNLFYKVANAPKEPNSIYSDPLFVDITKDWRLLPGSPAIGSGTKMPKSFEGNESFGGLAIFEVDLVDYDDNPRTEPWDMGVYNYDD